MRLRHWEDLLVYAAILVFALAVSWALLVLAILAWGR